MIASHAEPLKAAPPAPAHRCSCGGTCAACSRQAAPVVEPLPAQLPKISVRSFSILPPGDTPRDRGDKSTDEESEFQDQSVSVTTYETKPDGAHLEAQMQNVFVSPEFPDGFRWTQTIDTNAPQPGASSPYVDPHPNDDAKPFYWTDAEQAAHPTTFVDFPKRPKPAAGVTNWEATLCLDGVNEAAKTVTTFDCVTWGFDRDNTGAVTLHSLGSALGLSHRSALSREFPAWTFRTVGHAGLGALAGAAAGAGIGAIFGPVGALVGGALGALGGAIIGSFL